MSTSDIQRVPTRLSRWYWTVSYADGRAVGGWAATRWGARRQIRRVEANRGYL